MGAARDPRRGRRASRRARRSSRSWCSSSARPCASSASGARSGFLKKFYGWYLGRGRFPRPFKQELVQLRRRRGGRAAAVRRGPGRALRPRAARGGAARRRDEVCSTCRSRSTAAASGSLGRERSAPPARRVMSVSRRPGREPLGEPPGEPADREALGSRGDRGGARLLVALADAIAAARDRFGGIDLPASLVGMLTAIAVARPARRPIVGAAVGAIGYQTGLQRRQRRGHLAGEPDRRARRPRRSRTSIGGWTAGRIARYDGARNGADDRGGTIVLRGALSALAAWFGSEYDEFANVRATAVDRPRRADAAPRSPRASQRSRRCSSRSCSAGCGARAYHRLADQTTRRSTRSETSAAQVEIARSRDAISPCEAAPRPRLHAQRFRSQTSRRPSSVRNGSTRSIVRACGAIRSASPPVATPARRRRARRGCARRSRRPGREAVDEARLQRGASSCRSRTAARRSRP